MTQTPNTHRDEKDSVQETSRVDASINPNTPSLNEGLSALHALEHAVKSDGRITAKTMNETSKAIGNIVTTIAERDIPIVEIQEDSEIQRNNEIFQEILRGNILNMSELTYLTDDVAMALGRYGKGVMDLKNVRTITPRQAGLLKGRSMMAIDLSSLQSISDEALDRLVEANTVRLVLNGLTSITYAQAISLATFPNGQLYLCRLHSITDDQAKILAMCKVDHLILTGLTISDAQAEILYPIRKKIRCSQYMKEQFEAQQSFWKFWQ